MSQENKGSSSKSTSDVQRRSKKKRSSKTHNSDVDSNKNLSEDSVKSSTIFMDSAQKTHHDKESISVSEEEKKRSPKLEGKGEDEKKPTKHRHNENKRANSDVDSNKNSSQEILFGDLISSTTIPKNSPEKTRHEKSTKKKKRSPELEGQGENKKNSIKRRHSEDLSNISKKYNSDVESNGNSSQEILFGDLVSSIIVSSDSKQKTSYEKSVKEKKRSPKLQGQGEDMKKSIKRCHSDEPLNISKKDNSDVDSNKNSSQEILFRDLISSTTIPKDSAHKTRHKQSVKEKKRSPKLGGQGEDKKKSIKRRYSEELPDISRKYNSHVDSNRNLSQEILFEDLVESSTISIDVAQKTRYEKSVKEKKRSLKLEERGEDKTKSINSRHSEELPDISRKYNSDKNPSQKITFVDLFSSMDSTQKTRHEKSVTEKKRFPKLEEQGEDKTKSIKSRHSEELPDISRKYNSDKNPSQKITFVDLFSSMDSTQETRHEKSVTEKKRFSKLEERGEDKKKSMKRRHIEKPLNISKKSVKRSITSTKENVSERDSRTKKPPQDTMLKWLESPSNNRPSTSKITSPKRRKSSENDTPKKMSHDKKRRIKKETSENGLKSSQNIMSNWLSPGTPKVLNSSLDIITISPEKTKHLKHDKKKRRKHKKNKATSQETDKSKENLPEKSSQAILSGWLGSPKTPESINAKHKTKSHKHKEKPPTQLMSLKALENLSRDKLRNLTMQQIFGPDTSSADAPTAAKENISKPRKKRKKSSPDIDELPTFQANLPKQSESFKKYGVVIPTVEEILAERKKHLIYKTLVNKAKVIPLLPNPFDNLLKEPVKLPMKLLDCKHLSLEEIKEQFNKNKTILENIKNGTEYSEKHQKFHKNNSILPYNPSNLVFAYKQINCMADLIREEFDPKEKHLRYTFAVLIPELCLLIFMDTHQMTKDETVKYLEERPID